MLSSILAAVVAGLVAVGAMLPSVVPPSTTAPSPPTTVAPGTPDDEIHAFGSATFLGSTADLDLASPVVGMAATRSGQGYWSVAADGGVFDYGDAEFHGSAGDIRLESPIVAMASTPSGDGYWLVAADGGVFDYGDAEFHGSAGSLSLVSPIVGMASTPSGDGYWLVGADGGIFAYGDARFLGSVDPEDLAAPVTGVVATPSGEGYWLVGADGGIFAYGDARFLGSSGDVALSSPVVDMAPTPTGDGYWLFAADGGVFAYGDAEFFGGRSGELTDQRIVDAEPAPDGAGYWLAGGRLARLPLRGERVENVPDRPALAVKIDNIGAATPQWGLESTDVVIEEIVEGDITRFVAIFHSLDAPTVGPVRSARTSDIDLLALLGRPLFAFSGGNQGVRAAVSNADVVDLNHGLYPGAYVRTGARRAPHNLLTTTDDLRALDPGTPGPPQMLQYRAPEDGAPAGAAPAQGVDLTIGGVGVRWRWDPATERWLRWQRGAPHVSADGGQLGATNVVVMFVDYVPSGVDSRSPEAVSVGEGEAWILIDGTLTGGRWQRPAPSSPLRFVDADGAPVELEPGNTWIELPRPGTGAVVP